VDGVVDFRVRAYSTNGNQFTNGSTQGQAFVIVSSGLVPGDYTYEFRGGSVPAYVEVELGVVEDRVLAHYNALTNTSGVQTAAQNYLTNHAAQIHIFRQRVPIANVNPAAL